jgi:hypothetical protein
MNIFSMGWNEPTRVYMLGFMRELWIQGGRNLIFKGDAVILACNESNDQLYFFDSNKERGPVRSTPVGIDSLMRNYKEWHFNSMPSYSKVTNSGSPMVKIDHSVPPSGSVEPIGYCRRIDYFAKKKSSVGEFKHDHKQPYPILCRAPKSNQLYYVSGSYYVDPKRGVID